MTLHFAKATFSLTFLLALMVGISYHAIAQQQTIRVGINDRGSETTVLISPEKGKYAVRDDKGESIYDFRSDDVLSVQAVGDSLMVRGVYGLDRKVSGIVLSASGMPSSLLLKFTRDGKEQRYASDMAVTSKANRLVMVNIMDLDAYVSRVVQSEVGGSAVEEYYKIQSIISRTYAMGNLNRHTEQGYDVCDHQHCQVFDSKKVLSDVVVRAAAATSGIVMTDTTHRPILAAFHANCGGQTANAQDVWSEPRSYLVSVTDTFCTDQRSAVWKDTLYVDGLKAFVGSDFDSLIVDGLTWAQPQRKAHWELNGHKFRTSEMRREFKLRSTFFDMEVKGTMAYLNGRGFGHGVGICQQGAMEMAKQGFTYSEILGHYYTGVALVNVSTLK